MDQKDNKTTCMACSCPCEMHKEHNHLVSPEGGSASGGEEKHEEAKTCSACGHEHKQDGKCDCGCK